VCDEPCSPLGVPFCGPEQRCFVDKKPYGIFAPRCETIPMKRGKKGKPAKINSKLICYQPKVTGLCEANLQRYYYNPLIEMCELFIYGGCQGNTNNFETRAECEMTCEV